MALTDRLTITDALAAFTGRPLKEAARHLLGALGYRSDRTLAGPDSSPDSFLTLFSTSASERPFDPQKAMLSEWKTANLLFQLTDQELSRESKLFTDTSVAQGLLRSYVFIAIELKGSEYARGKFSAITRQINRLFPMPVMVFFKHQARLTIAVINRRPSKVDESKDVLGKVTLISGIDLAQPHRGHLDILTSLALPNLVHPQKKPITDFDTLHATWEQIFNVELLNERFYRELANWYFWAIPQVDFPDDLSPDSAFSKEDDRRKNAEKRRATGLIRLLTRLIFCWFLKEKSLIPEKLFHPTDLANILKDFDPESETSSAYYQAILQNLFFATLNQRMGKDAKGQPYRAFAKDEGFAKNRATYDVNNLYRYEALFREAPEAALAHFADIPFLNGGLFECLDRTEDGTNKKRYLDGFSRNPKKRPQVPDRIFFDSGENADLSGVYADKKRKAERVTGLISILNRYKFTIVENTPIDQEIALDPELLGKVFENLLASYVPETGDTARKQTGSFYTPRPIVDYMVDESLKAHFNRVLVEKARMKEPDARAGLDLLFAYTEKEHAFTPTEVACLIAAIDALKILDPACGSGAFPMGVLHKLVYILGKLDPANDRWKQTQLAKLDSAPMREELERAFADNNDDYGRKLSLIEHCLYGVDIQPIAIQITKLRFFISLVCDEKTNRSKRDNHGVRPLPNLETKFVAADALIALPTIKQGVLVHPRIDLIEQEIEALYHGHFSIQRRDQKLALQRKLKTLRQELAKLLAESLGSAEKSQRVADWEPFDPQSWADFFDPHWMFGPSLATGFDIVIGNPPYLFISNLDRGIRENYARQFTTAEYRFDLYGFFIERAVREFMHSDGLLAYIIPHTLLSNDSFSKLRKLLLEKCAIQQVIDIGPSVFSGASNETMILLVRKGPPAPDHAVWVRNTTATDFPEGESQFHIAQSKWLCNAKFSWPVRVSALRYELLARLSMNSVLLGSLCTINQGLRTGDNAKYIRAQPEGANWKPVVGGKDIGLYAPVRPDGYVLYDPAVLDAPRREDIFTSRAKIIVQEIRNIALPRRIVATIDYNQTFALQSTNVINLKSSVPRHVSLEYVLAVLNSSIANYFFRQSFSGNNHIASNQLAVIPIHNPSPIEALACQSLVHLVMLAKRTDNQVEAAFLEELIDACVMECYFREHMSERDLLFLDTLAPHLAAYVSTTSEPWQRDFLTRLHATLNAPSHPIRNRLLRLTADSPALLAVIKEEGCV